MNAVASRFFIRSSVALCLAGALTCGLSACGSDGGKASGNASNSDTPKVAVDTSWEPPRSVVNPHIYVSELDQILYPDQAQTDTIRSAVKARVIQCMSEKGYTYTELPDAAYSYSSDMSEAEIEGVYSYSSPQNAAAYGVSTPGFALSIKTSQARRSLPEPYIEALYGREGEKNTGCYHEGSKIFDKIAAKKQKLTQTVMDIGVKVHDQAEPTRKKLEKKWASCMANAGLGQYTTVDKINQVNGGEESWPEGAPSAEQVKVAKTSGECMITTGYLDEYSKYSAQIGHAYAQKNPGVITEWKKLHQAEVDAAKTALNGK